MQESFLHYIWQNSAFNLIELKTEQNQELQIIKVGIPNADGGPDFFNSQLVIGDTKWAGNVEIHTKSSDWFLHKHENDELYDKVILHVVWENDKQVFRKNGQEIPTLELKGRVKKNLLSNFQNLIDSNSWIPCYPEIKEVDEVNLKIQLSKCLVDRLETKSKRIEQIFRINNGDWESTCYQLLAKYFGFKTNALPFELLASTVDFKLIRQYSSKLNFLEALFYGQAGFLTENLESSYGNQLQSEYSFLKHKHQLKPIDVHMWKFLRMRPVNFPTIRIAQFAALWHKHPFLFQKVIQSKSIVDLRNIFDVEASVYWKSHFTFDKRSKRLQVKKLGVKSIDILLINAILPLQFYYLKSIGKDAEIVLDLYDSMDPENNFIIKRWSEYGIRANSAFDSQALLQLKSNYCDLKKCLICNVGNAILKSH